MQGHFWFLYRQRAQYTKTIYNFPNPGNKRSHQAEWKSENFDRLLSMYVGTARSANAIDERRKDFDRVTWGQADSKQLSQFWFAGNHSDIGGSYPETESRLSDISLQWMLEEVLKLDHPIKFGPVTVNGEAMAGAGAVGTPLHLYPDATSMQHSEISGTRDAIGAFRERLPRIFRGLLANANYEVIKRSILPTAKVHPTVKDRFALETVIDCAGDNVGAYRPEALRKHEDFKQFYLIRPRRMRHRRAEVKSRNFQHIAPVSAVTRANSWVLENILLANSIMIVGRRERSQRPRWEPVPLHSSRREARMGLGNQTSCAMALGSAADVCNLSSITKSRLYSQN